MCFELPDYYDGSLVSFQKPTYAECPSVGAWKLLTFYLGNYC